MRAHCIRGWPLTSLIPTATFLNHRRTEYECGKTGARETTPTPRNPFLSRGQKCDECLALRERKENNELTDVQYRTELIEILNTTKRKNVRNPPRVLQLMIQSTDILLQHNRGLQKCYLVSFKHKNTFLEARANPLQHAIKDFKGLSRKSATLQNVTPEHEASRKRKQAATNHCP